MAEHSDFVLEPLREGAVFTLYRGREHGNHTPILAVAIVSEQPSPQSLRRLEHEYSLAAELDVTWAAQPLALTRYQGRAVLILKDPGGEPLDEVIEQHKGRPIELARFLRIAISLAAALNQAHQRGLIHKDVKPANALVDDSGHAWLTGFGIASRLPRERQAPAPPEIIAGTLAYMSPEQTGRMNRSMDTRSDLYSLGITLYQMLTGALPFAAADPLEWVHCHIARQPIAPVDRRPIPEPLSALIMKLLAKNAEERYQTAAGLEADLRRCLSAWQSKGRIDPFPLGTECTLDRLLIPEKLYGREREVDALLAAFERVVAQGRAELVLVSGYSGVGKSSVVNELHKVLVPPRGLFAAGKFDQYKRDVPYATLAQAFQTLVRQILVKSQAEMDQWRYALVETLGPNGQLMVNLIPELEFVIGKQLPVAELPPQEARGRFQLVFRRFLGAFATAEHPLALFLDDLQWLDSGTLEMLESLITDPDLRHLLLVGAYRDNEVSSSHPLMRTLAAIRDAGTKTQQVVLAPLGADDVGRLVADALHCGRDSAGPLAQLIYEKTGGNPFFVIQFLAALAEEGLLSFKRDVAAPNKSKWAWDLDRIRGKGYSDNVVDIMLGKLRRLPHQTQTALQQLACLGNAAEITTLSMVFGQSEESIHSGFLDAARTGLIFRMEGYYYFPHDRIQEAAYALIPEIERAPAHLRIGRVLMANVEKVELAEHMFDVANQLNRGTTLLADHNERVKVAAINLSAGRKAKSSAAYASARKYFAAGLALLGEGDLSNEYELRFCLSLECAECELLCGNPDAAELLIEGLLPRAKSKVDEAAVYHLKVHLHLLKSEIQQTVDTALACLRGFDIDLPVHPTEEQVRTEYEAVWDALSGRAIESLIDLPLMTDPDLQAAVMVMSLVNAPAYFIDFRLFCLLACHIVKVSIRHGMSSNSANAFCNLGVILGSVFHRYGEGYRFARLACDLVEKHSFTAVQAKVFVVSAVVAGWTQPVGAAIDFAEAGFRAAREGGDPAFGCYGMSIAIMYRHLRNDPLDVVWRESEMAMEFARNAHYDDGAAMFVSQQRFIATMQGRTASVSTFSDAQFDEATFEAQLAGRNPTVASWYWILKLKARFLSGDFAEALVTADNAEQLLWSAIGRIEMLDYIYYSALTVAALYETASLDEQQEWRELLREHEELLHEWAENYPPTFGDKHTLVLAEIARIEKRDSDALQLYERAIHSARENGFVQCEGLAHELAAQYYLSRGIETAGYACLRFARNCYDRWGGHGKVKQLDERYANLREERSTAYSATSAASIVPLDIETAVKASQAISSEMELPRLIEKLVRMAVENAGAERGLLILLRDREPRIEAEATTSLGMIEVVVRQAAVISSDLPQTVLQYAIRTRERVLLDDASTDNMHSKDDYVRLNRSRSVLCLPIVKQAKLIGALYLENNLTPRVFTPERVAVLEMLASQAAISLENAALYTELQRSEAFLAQAQQISQTGSFGWKVASGELHWSEETYNIVECDRTVNPTLDLIFQLLHPDDRDFVQQTIDDAIREKKDFDIEHRLLMPNGRVKHVHIIGRAVNTANLDFVGAVRDITDSMRAEDALRRAQAELAHANRVTTMGELTASLAHELSQPISGAMTNANVCLRRLGSMNPDLDLVREAATRTVRDTQRAATIIQKIRSQFEKGSVSPETLGVSEMIQETVALLRDEAMRYNISVRTELAADLPRIVGDRVQLQQVAMNLIVNSIDAMKELDGARELIIKSQRTENEQIHVSFSDTGLGFPPQMAEKIFEPFFTTKPHGTGMGLRISRSIIESHGGRLWAEAGGGRGAIFHLNLPAAIPCH